MVGIFAGKSVADACIAGCCKPGHALDGGAGCDCDGTSTAGAMCDEEIKCSAQRDAGGARDTDACSTVTTGRSGGADGGSVTCACKETRRIAVHAHKVLPKSGVDLAMGIERRGRVYARSVQWPAAAALLYVVAVLIAGRADRRGVLYGVHPPYWLWPGTRGYTAARQVLVNARVNHALLRWRYVMPGYDSTRHKPTFRRPTSF